MLDNAPRFISCRSWCRIDAFLQSDLLIAVPLSATVGARMLFRLLFPSWAFFDAVTDVPRLEVRRTSPDSAGEWTAALQAPSRRWWNVLYHPDGTAHLAMQSAVDRLAVERESGPPDPVSHGIVEAIAHRVVHAGQRVGMLPNTDERGHCWQWRLVAVDVRHPAAVRVLYESVPRAYTA